MASSLLAAKLHYHARFLPHLIRHYQNWPAILLSELKKTPLQRLKLRSGIQFVGNDVSLLRMVTDEIFFQRVYEIPPHVSVQPDDIVLDIGANVGVFSTYAAMRGAAQVHAYEPLPATVKLFRQNCALNNLKNVTVTAAAVSGKNGKAKLYLGHLDVGNLLFDHNSVGKLEHYNTVKTVTLAEIFKQHKLTHVDFLKLDCEGSEGAILLNTPNAVWKKIDKIALEYHDNVSALSHEEIVTKLEKLGYSTKLVSDSSDFGYIYAWQR